MGKAMRETGRGYINGPCARPSEADGATLDDFREAATTLEELERAMRRVFGGAHPFTPCIEHRLREARAALRARETQPSPPPSGSV